MSVPITGEMVILFLTIVGAIAALWWRIEGRLSEQDRAHSALARELAEYKLFVAQNHVSASALKDAETRLIDAIEKLGKRLDVLADRFDVVARRP